MKDLKEVESNYIVKRSGRENFRYKALRLEEKESNLTEGSQDFSTNKSFSYENNTKLEIFSQNIDRQGIQIRGGHSGRSDRLLTQYNRDRASPVQSNLIKNITFNYRSLKTSDADIRVLRPGKY